jgi:hypothetical protein
MPNKFTMEPSVAPTIVPSLLPTYMPTIADTIKPTLTPTYAPSAPTSTPSSAPSNPTKMPTMKPTSPTISPTLMPTVVPSEAPTMKPTSPTVFPTLMPTIVPSNAPTVMPTAAPTINPSFRPTQKPTITPSFSLTQALTFKSTNLSTNSTEENKGNLSSLSASLNVAAIGAGVGVGGSLLAITLHVLYVSYKFSLSICEASKVVFTNYGEYIAGAYQLSKAIFKGKSNAVFPEGDIEAPIDNNEIRQGEFPKAGRKVVPDPKGFKASAHESKFSEEKSTDGIGSYFSKSMAFFSQGEYSIVRGIAFMPFSADRELQEIGDRRIQEMLLDSALNARNTISTEVDRQMTSLENLRNLGATNNQEHIAQDDEESSVPSLDFLDEGEDESASSVIFADEDDSVQSIVFADEDQGEGEESSAPSIVFADEGEDEDTSAAQLDYS